MNTTTSCAQWPYSYPTQTDGAVALRYFDFITICGGYPITKDCYAYNYHYDRWDLMPFELEPMRQGAISIEMPTTGEWVVLGGYGSQGPVFLTDTLVLRDGVFVPGPRIPKPIYYGSAARISDTEALIAGAMIDYSNAIRDNWIMQLPSMSMRRVADSRNLPGSSDHCSGTFFNSTANEYQVANIGHHGIEIYSPRDDVWTTLSLTVSITGAQVVQQGYESFYVIGGYDLYLDAQLGSVYHFNETGLNLVQDNVLTIARYKHIAMSIPDQQVVC